MASTKNGKKTTPRRTPAERKTLYARLPASVHKKLERLAAAEGAKRGSRVTMQDVVIGLIQGAPG